jgi:ribosome maturation factor RimP
MRGGGVAWSCGSTILRKPIRSAQAETHERVGRWPTLCFRSRSNPLFDAASIETLIAPSLEAMGYRVVRVAFTGGRRATLQVMVERSDEAAMTVEDCATVSHSVSALLDVADPIAGAYTLEVSSPGIDRPLVKREDYERFAGFEAKLELAELRDGRRRFRGRIHGLEGDEVRLDVDGESVLLPLAAITRARLVLTDELIAATNRHNRT